MAAMSGLANSGSQLTVVEVQKYGAGSSGDNLYRVRAITFSMGIVETGINNQIYNFKQDLLNK